MRLEGFIVAHILGGDNSHLIPTFSLFFELARPGRDGRRKMWCRPAQSYIANVIGRTRRTVIRHIAELKRLGLIRVKARYHKGWRVASLYLPGRRLIRIIKDYGKKFASSFSRGSSPSSSADQYLRKISAALENSKKPETKEAARRAFSEIRSVLKE